MSAILRGLVRFGAFLVLSATIIPFHSSPLIRRADAENVTSVEVWWPAKNTELSGIQPLKAIVQNWSVSDYSMYWQVDGDRLNAMTDNYADYPHKEIDVDFTGWNWKGSGPYTLTFKAFDKSGVLIARADVPIYTKMGKSNITQNSATPVSVTAPTNLSGNNPLSGAKLYVNPYNDTRRWFTERSNSDPANAALMKKIADQPESEWFGDWNRDIEGDARRTTDQITASGAVPVYVAYNIPQRDCGAYSAGGAGSGDAYKNWISGLANGIGNRKAVVLLEPDALPWLDCLSTKDQDTRVGLISDAVNILKSHPQIAVYLDAGHPSWKSADEMSSILLRAGISRADGFSLNISNFVSTGENISYGTKISEKTGGKHFVIDTGRNGNGSNGEWCNPWGRALGNKPNTSTGNNLVDAYLWVKGPGGSDGPCNGGPSAGVFWPDYALDIARNTSWW